MAIGENYVHDQRTFIDYTDNDQVLHGQGVLCVPAMMASVASGSTEKTFTLQSCLKGTRTMLGQKFMTMHLRFTRQRDRRWVYRVCQSPDLGYSKFIPAYQNGSGPYNVHRKELPPGGAAELGVPQDNEDALYEADILLPPSLLTVSLANARRKGC